MFYFWKGILKKNTMGRCYLIHEQDDRVRRITPVELSAGSPDYRSGQRVIISGTWDGRRIFAGSVIPVELPRRKAKHQT